MEEKAKGEGLKAREAEPKHPNWHPLVAFFHARKFTTAAGMNWLQERGLISDLCVEPADVARVDVVAVLTRAEALHYLPK